MKPSSLIFHNPEKNFLRYPLTQHLLCLLPVSVLLGLFWGVLGPDDAVVGFFADFRQQQPSLTVALRWFTQGCNVVLYSIYVLLLAIGLLRPNKELRNFVLSFILALVITLALVYLCKYIVGRPRPMSGGFFVFFSLSIAYHSFPSGHVTETLLAAIPLAQRLNRPAFSLFLGLIALLMAFSRVYLGKHYPSDILGSILFGSLGAYLAWLFLTRRMTTSVTKA